MKKKHKDKWAKGLLVIHDKKTCGVNSGYFYSTSWKAGVYVVFNTDQLGVKRFFKHQFDMDYEMKPCGGRCVEVLNKEKEEVGNVIILPEWDGGPKSHSILAHEALHATYNILAGRGMRLSVESEEAYAYLIQEIVDRSLQIITGKIRY